MVTVSPVLKLIIHRTLPLTVGVFSIMFVQLVDTIFIGQLGLDELTVQGITMPFHTVLVGLKVGIGVAATSIISQATGAQQPKKATETATISLVFGIVFITLICLLLWLFRDLVFGLFVGDDVTVEHSMVLLEIFNRYWPIWLLSAVSSAVLYLITAVFRANQDTKTTGVVFAAASIINLILDPILIFTLKMGIAGAAIASTIGYVVCIFYMLLKAKNKNWFAPVRITSNSLGYFSSLIRMATSTTANQILPSVSALLTMLFISGIGTEAIAFWSLLSRVESFLLIITLALTMSVPPIVGRYLGEGKFEDISLLLTTTAKLLLGFHLLIALLIALSSNLLIPVLSDEVQLKTWMSFALWVIPFSYGPLGLCMVVVSAFNALNLPKRALLISFARLFVFYIPAIWIGTQSGSVTNTVIAATIANLLAGLYAWSKLRQHMKQKDRLNQKAIA